VKKKGAKAEGKVYATHELVHASLEEAMFAAIACTKCVPSAKGIKGCRSCMGELFETIRQRKGRYVQLRAIMQGYAEKLFELQLSEQRHHHEKQLAEQRQHYEKQLAEQHEKHADSKLGVCKTRARAGM